MTRACDRLTWADGAGEMLCQPAPFLQPLLVVVTILLGEEGLEVLTEGGGGLSPVPQLLAKPGQLSGLVLHQDEVFPKVGGREASQWKGGKDRGEGLGKRCCDHSPRYSSMDPATRLLMCSSFSEMSAKVGLYPGHRVPSCCAFFS